MEAGLPCFGGHSHWGRGKVLYLFQLEVKTFGNDGQFCHIFFPAAGMAGDEVRDELLPQSFFAIDAVEYLFEFLEQAE